MEKNLGRRIRNRLINSATAVLFSLTDVSYGSALAQDTRNSLDPIMGELSRIPERSILGEGVGDFLAGRLERSETPLYEVHYMEGYEPVAEENCSMRSSDGTVFFGVKDDVGNCGLSNE